MSLYVFTFWWLDDQDLHFSAFVVLLVFSGPPIGMPCGAKFRILKKPLVGCFIEKLRFGRSRRNERDNFARGRIPNQTIELSASVVRKRVAKRTVFQFQAIRPVLVESSHIDPTAYNFLSVRSAYFLANFECGSGLIRRGGDDTGMSRLGGLGNDTKLQVTCLFDPLIDPFVFRLVGTRNRDLDLVVAQGSQIDFINTGRVNSSFELVDHVFNRLLRVARFFGILDSVSPDLIFSCESVVVGLSIRLKVLDSSAGNSSLESLPSPSWSLFR